MTEDELKTAEFLAGVMRDCGDTEEAEMMERLIAEVRRLKTENRVMQSRLDIAEGRVEGMKNL